MITLCRLLVELIKVMIGAFQLLTAIFVGWLNNISRINSVIWNLRHIGLQYEAVYDSATDIIYAPKPAITRINGSTGVLIPTTTITTDWAGQSSAPETLAFGPNNILYAHGHFNSCQGVTRFYICAIDMNTAEVTDWNPSSNWPVSKMLLSSDGSKLYYSLLVTN